MSIKITSPMLRTLLAFLAAPLWVPLVFAIHAAFFSSPPRFFDPVDQRLWILRFVLIGVVTGYGAAVAVGLPVTLVLRSRGWTSVWAFLFAWTATGGVCWLVSLVAVGLLVGNDVSFVVRELVDTMASRPYVPGAALALGGVVGLTVWVIARPNSPPSP